MESNYKFNYPNLVLQYLKDGNTINRNEALKKFGITELNTVICVLRKRGHVIEGVYEHGKNRYGGYSRLMRYRLVEEAR